MAAFAYEEVNLGRYQLQFGGRLERSDYTVGERTGSNHDVLEEHGHELVPPTARDRDFMGGSASIGFRVDLASGNGFVANLNPVAPGACARGALQLWPSRGKPCL